MQSLDKYAQEKLDEIERRGLHRSISETVREDGIYIERGGKRLLSFSCNDYLNLTQHPALKRAAIDAIERYGVGSGASRLVTGNHPLYAELEARLARLKGAEAAVVFGSGYLANSGIIPVLIGEDGLVLIDELSHACLWAGAQLSRGRVRSVPAQRHVRSGAPAEGAPLGPSASDDRHRWRLLDGRRYCPAA